MNLSLPDGDDIIAYPALLSSCPNSYGNCGGNNCGDGHNNYNCQGGGGATLITVQSLLLLPQLHKLFLQHSVSEHAYRYMHDSIGFFRF